MATLGQIIIADRGSVFDSGAAFLLAQKCVASEIVRLDSGSEVEVRSGNPYVVGRVREAAEPADAFNRAHEAVQEALDHLAILGRGDVSIRDASDEHLVWWREGVEQVLRVVVTSTVSIRTGTVYMQIIRHGKLVPPPPTPKIIYNESLRYFRLSQVTEDLFIILLLFWTSR